MNITFDPVDPILLIVHAGWLVVGAALVLASGRTKSEWARASLAGLGLSVLGMFVLAIVPSWWLYFAETRLDWGGQGCVAINPATPDGLQCIKQAIKDTVVVVENAVAVGIFVVAFMMWQKKYPKQLAPGEPKPEATGGYK